MKSLKVICILALIMALSTTGFAQEAKRVAKVIEVEGSAEAKLKGSATWAPVEVGATLNEGDIIRTGTDSSLIINLDGVGETAAVEVNENSQLMITELIKDAEKGTQKTLLDLAIGKVLIRAQKLHSEKSKFEVKTPTSLVGVRGTTFAVDVEALE